MSIEREITTPVDLCRSDGRLDPEAVGWTRRPLHRADLRRRGRCKRWECRGIVTPRHIAGIVISSLDYAGAHGIYALDRETWHEIARDSMVPLARGTVLTERRGVGVSSAHGGVEIELPEEAPGISIEARTPGV